MLIASRDFALTRWIQRVREQEAFLYGLRVLVALGGAMAWAWWMDHLRWITPLFLGVIACALAEVDDKWSGRLRTHLVTLCSFALVAFTMEAAVQWPPGFALMMSGGALVFTLLGAVGDRYRTVATATLILTLYTAMSVGHGGGAKTADGTMRLWSAHYVPLLLLGGAAWYALLSVLWGAAFPLRPVRQGLAQLYGELSGYLSLKASLFEPVRGLDVEQRRLALAQANGRVVNIMNTMKNRLLSRMPRDRAASPSMLQLLNLYFIAQDLHERASSSHYLYNDWAEELFHSDVLYRCQRVLHLQGLACARLAEALRSQRPFERGQEVQQALADLDAAISFLEAQQRPHWQRPLRSLRDLARNLRTLDAQLSIAANPPSTSLLGDVTLFDPSVRSLGEAWSRIRQQITLRSPLMRFAIRLSVALGVGCVVMQLTDPVHGHWIVLTTLFVCLPTYGATVTRVVERVAGTVLGLVVGWALLRLFPGLHTQAFIAVAAGVLFFITRARRYVISTAAITLMVLMCFSQATGDAYSLIVPRLVDTLLGSLIATAAMLLVLPDWQGRRLNLVAAQALNTHAKYLGEILSQYASGKDDDLDYRKARRYSHNADAEFSRTLSLLLQEPAWARRNAEQGQRVLVLSHTLLNYISALGAHRGHVSVNVQDQMLVAAGDLAAHELARMATALRERRAMDLGESGELDGAGAAGAAASASQRCAQALEQAADSAGEQSRVVLNQLALICRQIDPLQRAVGELAAGPGL